MSNYVTLEQATHLYTCAQVQFVLHTVQDDRFLKLTRLIKSLDRELGERISDEVWRGFRGSLRRYLFSISSAPIPFATLKEESWFGALPSKLSLLRSLYPETGDVLREVGSLLHSLSQSHENPMMDKLLEIGGVIDGNASLLIKEPRLVQAAEEALASAGLKQLKVITPQILTTPEGHVRLIVIGAFRWFPQFVFTAPRAPKIDLVGFKGVVDRPRVEEAFAGSIRSGDAKPAYQGVFGEDSSDFCYADELVPCINWDRAVQGLLTRVQRTSEEEEIEARLVVLAGGRGVFLDAGGQVLAIKLQTNGAGDETHQDWINVEMLEPGMALLLRTAGGGDLIVPTADKVLGYQAVELRVRQSEWKGLLRQNVLKLGMKEVCRTLKHYGSTRADSWNVRGWMSHRSIKPQNYEDFLAITRLISAEETTQVLWENACRITAAHQKAGQHIRARLLKEVRKADLRDLRRLGRLDFQLPEEDGGSITAFVVQSIETKHYNIPASHIGQVFEGDEKLWPE